MIAEALKYLVGLAPPPTIQSSGFDYRVDGQGALNRIVPPHPSTLALSTLTGLVDVFKANIDQFQTGATALHVESHASVALVSLAADRFGHRQLYARATYKEELIFKFGHYYSPEEFLLALNASFLTTENTLTLIKLVSNLTAENSVQAVDDGLSQQVIVKTGTVTRDVMKIEPRVPLVPLRGFREPAPVESTFLIRLKGKNGELPSVALHETDGGQWKFDAVLAAKKWLQAQLPDAVLLA